MQVQSKKLSFKGQHVFVGLDVSKKSWKTCILCAYEAGFSGFWAHDQLEEAGVNCIVVNPALITETAYATPGYMDSRSKHRGNDSLYSPVGILQIVRVDQDK